MGTHFVDAAAAAAKDKVTNGVRVHGEEEEQQKMKKKPMVVSVLGGPGSGKGTQCLKIVQQFPFTHLSTGYLLREEIGRGSENATMIRNMMKEGQLVPHEIVLKLLHNAMLESGNDKFLLDGFPRDEETREAFEASMNIEPALVLFLDCPEELMQRRLLNRDQEREDDNIDSIVKRINVFRQKTLPVIKYYEGKGKVFKIDAAKPVEAVFEEVKAILDSKDMNITPRSSFGGHCCCCCCAIL